MRQFLFFCSLSIISICFLPTQLYAKSNYSDLIVQDIKALEENFYLPNEKLTFKNNQISSVKIKSPLQKIDFYIIDIIEKPKDAHVKAKVEGDTITIAAQGAGSYELVVKAMKNVEIG